MGYILVTVIGILSEFENVFIVHEVMS